MKIGIPQIALMALALSASVSAQTDRSCTRYDTAELRVGMTPKDVWETLGGKGDSIGTSDRPSGPVAVVRYTSREPTVEVEYDRDDIGKNRGTLIAVRSELTGEWAWSPADLRDRFGEPTAGADRLPGLAKDGPVEWVDPDCRVSVRVWHEPAAWWDPGSAKTWLEVRRVEVADVPAVATNAAPSEVPAPAPDGAPDGESPAPPAASNASAPVPATVSAVPVSIAGVDGVTTPVRIPSSYVAPVYPRIASIAGLDGVVRVQARIGATGEVLEFLSVDATPRARGFERAATDAIRQWRFTPAVLDGQPVEVLMPLVVEFKHQR